MKALFEIGQKVVCVDSKGNFGVPSGLIEGKKYSITGIRGCKCGVVGITVGVPEKHFKTMSCSCGRDLGKVLPERTFSQHRFIPTQSDEELSEQIRESLNQPALNKNY